MEGRIFNIQHFSVNDGPGIRTTAFLQGCPLHCAWCHNPEGIDSRMQFLWYEERCTRCGACVKACPTAVSYTHLDVYKRQMYSGEMQKITSADDITSEEVGEYMMGVKHA